LDFQNVLVEVGPSSKPATRNPRHYQRGAYDNQRFGLESNSTSAESAKCRLLSDPSVVEDIPAEYLRPVRPDDSRQVVVFLNGGEGVKGQQRTTGYLNDGSWMMEADQGEVVGLVMDEQSLCRIWKT
jgi:transcription elongation factor SPT5